MKLFISLCLFGLAFGQPTKYEDQIVHTAFNYHENIGIKEAALIKAAEESTDFDGSRIVGGSNTNLGQYPFLGGLLITMADGRTSVCGSSLISNTRSVTAAHCWYDGSNQAREFEVVLGTLTLFSGGTRVKTNNVVTHPNWFPLLVLNDVAVITIPFVGYTNNIMNIALASGSNNFVGSWANAAGYGVQRDGSGISTSQQQHHVSVQVITNNVCAQTYGFIVRDSNICVGTAGGRSTCGGDSGGPLEVTTGGQRTLIGITSFGHRDGCEIGYPAAFARVSSFNDWIRSRM